MSRKRSLMVGAGFILMGVLVAGALLIGKSAAPNSADTKQARADAYGAAFSEADQKAKIRANVRGRRAGVLDGARNGRKTGERRGGNDGNVEAEAQLAEIAAAEAEAAREAALAEVQERASNCGAPLFVEGYCPTDEEIAREGEAEALCAPGTAEGREEAAALGIQC